MRFLRRRGGILSEDFGGSCSKAPGPKAESRPRGSCAAQSDVVRHPLSTAAELYGDHQRAINADPASRR